MLQVTVAYLDGLVSAFPLKVEEQFLTKDKN